MVIAPALQVGVRRNVVVAVNAPLLHVREERRHRIEILRRDRIELVVVALRAAHRRAEPGSTDCADAVRGILREVFLRLRAAFARHHVQAIEAGRDPLLRGGVRQQVARELFHGEHVERLVLIERSDHVISIREDALVLVAVITDRVREPNRVKPGHRHALAEMR